MYKYLIALITIMVSFSVFADKIDYSKSLLNDCSDSGEIGDKQSGGTNGRW